MLTSLEIELLPDSVRGDGPGGLGRKRPAPQ